MRALAAVLALTTTQAIEPPAPTYAASGDGLASSEAGGETAPVEEKYAPDPNHRKLQVAGAASVGVGVASFIVMVAGLGLGSSARNQLDIESRQDLQDESEIDRLKSRESLGQGLAIGGGVGAGVLIVSGVTLMAIGYRRARAHYEAFHGIEARLRLQPAPGPGQFGAGLQLRF